MITLTTLPITAEDIDYSDDMLFLYNAKFNESFGEIEQNSFFRCVNISYMNGTIECFSTDDWTNSDIKTTFVIKPTV